MGRLVRSIREDMGVIPVGFGGRQVVGGGFCVVAPLGFEGSA